MGRCLADGAAYENYICNSKHETAASVVGQGARPKRAKKGPSVVAEVISSYSLCEPHYLNTEVSKADLLTRRERFWTEIGTDGNERTRDDTRVVTYRRRRRR